MLGNFMYCFIYAYTSFYRFVYSALEMEDNDHLAYTAFKMECNT